MAPARRGSPRGSGGGERLARGWRKRALAVLERCHCRTARGPAPRRTGTAAVCALAACASVCAAVIATVMASRGVTA